MEDSKISKVLVFVLLVSVVPFYGAETEKNAEIMMDPIDQQLYSENQGFVARICDKAQRIVTMPVNYVFGEKDSYAKKTFYVVVGGAVLVVAGYSSYRYFYGNLMKQVKKTDVKELQEQAEAKVRKSDEEARIVEQAQLMSRLKKI